MTGLGPRTNLMDKDSEKLIQVHVQGKVTLVEFVQAKIYDISTVEGLDRVFQALVEDLPTTQLLVDFARVDFMVTRVINLLLVLLKRAREAGGDVCLCGMNANIRRVFELMRLTQIFVIYDDRAKALATLKA